MKFELSDLIDSKHEQMNNKFEVELINVKRKYEDSTRLVSEAS